MRKTIYTDSEYAAEIDLRKFYDHVQRTPTGAFYDFLVKHGTTDLLIEVKWAECRFKSINIYFRWKPTIKLLKAKNFMIYILTPKGNFFVSPKQFLEFVHIHHNRLNPHEKSFLLRATVIDGQFVVMEPQRCLLCEGKITDHFLNNLPDVKHDGLGIVR